MRCKSRSKGYQETEQLSLVFYISYIQRTWVYRYTPTRIQSSPCLKHNAVIHDKHLFQLFQLDEDTQELIRIVPSMLINLQWSELGGGGKYTFQFQQEKQSNQSHSRTSFTVATLVQDEASSKYLKDKQQLCATLSLTFMQYHESFPNNILVIFQALQKINEQAILLDMLNNQLRVQKVC